MISEFQYKQIIDGLDVEYELIPFSDLRSGEAQIDELLDNNAVKIDKLTNEIKELSVNCDEWDYSVSALSGIISGVLDIFLVGGIGLDSASVSNYHEIGKEQAEKAIKRVAKLTGFKNQKGFEGEDLLKASIDYLQGFNLPSDKVTSFFGGGRQHHLRDFAHHPTLFGLICSILSQITGIAVGTTTTGVLTFTKVTDYRGSNIFDQVFCGTFHWMLHLLSDIDGTNVSAGAGTGIPGVLLSTIKEIDGIRNSLGKNASKEKADELSIYISKLFNGTAFSEVGPDGKKIPHRFDFRTEIGIAKQESGKMAIPIIINECVVRAFFLIKRLVIEIKQNPFKSISDFTSLNWIQILPFNNASITRMLTISIGTMEAIDITEATIHGVKDAVEMGETVPTAIIGFAKGFLLHINYVGVGRFAITLGAEVHFTVKREGKITERIAAYDRELSLMDAKLYYRKSDMWISAYDAGKSIDEAYGMIVSTQSSFNEAVDSITDNLERIDDHIDEAEEKNPGLKEDMLKTLKWGL